MSGKVWGGGVAMVRAARMVCLIGALAVTGAQARDGAVDAVPTPAEESFKPESGHPGKDVIWVPTPDEIVKAMLDMANLKAGEVHYDLGSGDGKIVIAAARRGADSTGVEFNPDMVGLAQRNAARAGLPNARFVQGDIFETDFSKADVVTLYLLPTLNLRLRPKLLELKPGTRIASHQFPIGDWEPDQRVTLNGRDALFWVVPARVGGSWSLTTADAPELRLQLEQRYQKVDGLADWGKGPSRVDGLQLSGADLRFVVLDGKGIRQSFEGKAGPDGSMSGMVTDASGVSRPFKGQRLSP